MRGLVCLSFRRRRNTDPAFLFRLASQCLANAERQKIIEENIISTMFLRRNEPRYVK